MNILIVYPTIDIETPSGMDSNRIAHLKHISNYHEVDVWIVGGRSTRSEKSFLQEQGINNVYSSNCRPGQHNLLIRSLVARHSPVQNLSSFSKTIKKLNRQNYDVVSIETIGLAPLVKSFTNTPVVWSLVDSPSFRKRRFYEYYTDPRRKYKSYAEWKIAYKLEEYYSRYSDIIHVVSDVESEYLGQEFTNVETCAIPVILPRKFIDTSNISQSKHDVVVLGHRDIPYINQGIKQYVFPALNDLSQSVEQLDVTFIGRGSMMIPEEYSDIVEQPGWVEDYASELNQASVAIVPDPVGSGIKNRTVQSLALGTPVVGTSYAFEGIDIDPQLVGCEIDSPEEVYNCIQELLLNQETRRRMSRRGRKFATQRFGTDNIIESWRSLYHRAAD